MKNLSPEETAGHELCALVEFNPEMHVVFSERGVREVIVYPKGWTILSETMHTIVATTLKYGCRFIIQGSMSENRELDKSLRLGIRIIYKLN